MVIRPGMLCLALVALVSVAGCVTPGPSGSGGDGGKRLPSGDADSRAAALERAAALARDPAARADALIQAGRVRLEAGQARRALQHFYEARSQSQGGITTLRANLGVGDAYFELGEYALARRYISKGLDGVRGEDREEALARLVVASRGLDDLASSTEYRGKLSQPFSESVRRILATEPRRSSLPELEPANAGEDEVRSIVQVPPGRRPRATDESREGSGSAERPSLTVIPRGTWNARAPRRNIDPMGKVEKITVHHTGDDASWGMSKSDAAEEIRSIQRYHQNDHGWADIGYHYIIDRTGTVWQGRRLRYQGAHARGAANYGNIGVVLLGNYLHHDINSLQRRSLEALVAKLCEHFALSPRKVYTHREILHGKTDCPGPALTRCVTEIRENLRRKLVAYQP